MSLSSIDVAASTDPGKVRPGNEDAAGTAWHPSGDAVLVIVADGVGGLKDGAYAAQLAIDSATGAFQQASGDFEQVVNDALLEVNRHLFDRAGGDDTRLAGTTIVALVLREDASTLFNAGDSRGYRYSGGTLEQVTSDHSWVNEQVQAGLMSAEDAESSPQRNIITRCLGVEPEIEVDRFDLPPLAHGDTFLLSTDGLHGVLDTAEISGLLANDHPADRIAFELIARANSAGGPDNIGVGVARLPRR